MRPLHSPLRHSTSQWLVFTVLWMSLFILYPWISVCSAEEDEQSDNSDQVCVDCHLDPKTSKTVEGKKIPLEFDHDAFKASVHSEEGCESCHEDFDPKSEPHRPEIKAVSCEDCHSEVIDEGYEDSVHGPLDDPTASCTECHGTHDILPVDEPGSRVHGKELVEMCSDCHSDEVDDFLQCPHWKAYSEGLSEAPLCTHCHSAHKITETPDKEDLIRKRTLNEVCTDCHISGSENLIDRMHAKPGFIHAYQRSIHGREDENGTVAALCVDCHSPHRVGNGDDHGSTLARKAIADTCGTCHEKEKEIYRQSIHGQGMAKGNTANATCTDCHGEHLILSADSPTSGLRGSLLATETCGACHASVKLARKYGFSVSRLQTYQDSYHGLAVIGGSVRGADCASCHGYHNILPSTNPASRVHVDNLEKTCGECHEGSTATFARIPVHAEYTSKAHPIAYYVKWIYIWLIVVVVSGMILHNMVIFSYYVRKKWQQESKTPTYQRFLPFEVIQHFLLIISFVLLAITGFALKFPDSFWVKGLVYVGMTEELRGLVHRIAAALLVWVSLVQAIYFVFYRRGRREIVALWPRFKDFSDLAFNMLFHLGLRKTPPKFDRFDYTEKAEYLALIWGTVVMAVTGFILWFPEFSVVFAADWLFDVAQVIHYYEAWLATLAIIVWHLFFVIFHPHDYPLSMVLFTGEMTEEECKKRHALEFERLHKAKTDAEE